MNDIKTDPTDPIGFVVLSEKDGLYDYVTTFMVNDPRYQPGAQDVAGTRVSADQFALNYLEGHATPDDVNAYAIYAVPDPGAYA